MKKFFNGSHKLTSLAKRMKRGDNSAAAQLYDELVGKVFGYCINRVHYRQLAEDLTQDIFLKLVTRIETFDPAKGHFTVWFWQIARNTLFDYYRRQKEISFADMSDQNQVEGLLVSENSEIDADYRLKRQRLDNFMKSLPEDDQELFQLRYIAELSYKEISKIFGKPEGSLRVAVNRLTKKVRQSLEENNENS